MRVLLDTHALIWLVTGDPRLSSTARKVFLDPANDLLCSAVTGFEIAVKYSLGKLYLTEPPALFIDNRIRNNGLIPLSITLAHACRLADLPLHHRDPFDRLLIAQALLEQVPLLSADAAFDAYSVQRLW